MSAFLSAIQGFIFRWPALEPRPSSALRVCDPRPHHSAGGRFEDRSQVDRIQFAADAGERLVDAGQSHSLGSVQINLGLVVTTKPGRPFLLLLGVRVYEMQLLRRAHFIRAEPNVFRSNFASLN